MPPTPARRYLDLLAQRLRAMRRDLPHLADLGAAMAEPLLAGGQLFLPAVGTFWPSEFGNRAGGLMRLRLGESAGSRRDAAYLSPPDPRTWDPRQDKVITELLAGPMQLFVNGRPQDVAALGNAKRFAGFTGGVNPALGLGCLDDRQPLAPLRPFEQLVRGWAAAGEMVAACTRGPGGKGTGGKMPILWMSVWLEGALVRNAHFVEHDNRQEPWFPPVFHRDLYIQPLAPGRIGGEFLDVVEGLHAVLARQVDQLAEAGRWLAQARRAGKRIFAVLVGHSYPMILDLAKDAPYPVEWGRSISDVRHALPADFGAGDVAIHLGYAPTRPADVAYWLKRGVRLIHTSPYGRTAGIKDHRNLIWLDLPWRPGDACVDIPGYSVRVIPSSSSAHTMAFFAMLAEMAGRMGWE